MEPRRAQAVRRAGLGFLLAVAIIGTSNLHLKPQRGQIRAGSGHNYPSKRWGSYAAQDLAAAHGVKLEDIPLSDPSSNGKILKTDVEAHLYRMGKRFFLSPTPRNTEANSGNNSSSSIGSSSSSRVARYAQPTAADVPAVLPKRGRPTISDTRNIYALNSQKHFQTAVHHNFPSALALPTGDPVTKTSSVTGLGAANLSSNAVEAGGKSGGGGSDSTTHRNASATPPRRRGRPPKRHSLPGSSASASPNPARKRSLDRTGGTRVASNGSSPDRNSSRHHSPSSLHSNTTAAAKDGANSTAATAAVPDLRGGSNEEEVQKDTGEGDAVDDDNSCDGEQEQEAVRDDDVKGEDGGEGEAKGDGDAEADGAKATVEEPLAAQTEEPPAGGGAEEKEHITVEDRGDDKVDEDEKEDKGSGRLGAEDEGVGVDASKDPHDREGEGPSGMARDENMEIVIDASSEQPPPPQMQQASSSIMQPKDEEHVLMNKDNNHTSSNATEALAVKGRRGAGQSTAAMEVESEGEWEVELDMEEHPAKNFTGIDGRVYPMAGVMERNNVPFPIIGNAYRATVIGCNLLGVFLDLGFKRDGFTYYEDIHPARRPIIYRTVKTGERVVAEVLDTSKAESNPRLRWQVKLSNLNPNLDARIEAMQKENPNAEFPDKVNTMAPMDDDRGGGKKRRRSARDSGRAPRYNRGDFGRRPPPQGYYPPPTYGQPAQGYSTYSSNPPQYYYPPSTYGYNQRPEYENDYWGGGMNSRGYYPPRVRPYQGNPHPYGAGGGYSEPQRY